MYLEDLKQNTEKRNKRVALEGIVSNVREGGASVVEA